MKIIVAHPAQQHSYRLATALKKEGFLQKYITTVYYKKKSLTYFVSQLLKGNFKKKAENRRCEEIEDDDVLQFCEAEGLLKLLCIYFKPMKKYYSHIKYNTADRFAKKVAAYAIKNNVDMVITYDDSSPLLFEILKEKAPNIKRVLDVSAANRLYMKEIYDRDIELAPKFANRLKQECSIVWDNDFISRNKRELESSQFFLVPSDFVAKSLKFSNIKDEQIIYCPYGVDISMFSCKSYNLEDETKTLTLPIRFIYVGVAGEYKGISYLMNAFSMIPKDQATLTIVGSYESSDNLLKNTDNVHFIGRVPHDDLPKILAEHDVFVFPSLGDSYSLSAMEAAACGLPLIVSYNTGMCDSITNGVEGFVIPQQSTEAIIEKVQWYVMNSEKIPEMGMAARKMAEKSSWDNYYKEISKCIYRTGPETIIRGVELKKPLKFIYVGGLKELKGIYYLLEAFKKIDKSKAQLVIVGNQDSDDDVVPYYDFVTFTGAIPHWEVPRVLSEADVFVFPSLGEGMSLSVLEAAACGLPLIISENSGISEKITDGKEGFLIKIQSVDDIVEKVMWFVDHPNNIPEMGYAARRMAEKYTWQRYYETVAHLLSAEEYN